MSEHTAKIYDYFERLNAIPRCSGNEAQVRKWLNTWADRLGFEAQGDSGGNLVVRVPASAGHDTCPPVIIQGHMDMVCEKTPESNHDFSKDPIVSHREQEWLTAGDTTLGADNGIAIAYMMVLAETSAMDRPPLELLFTVDEETGLNGAKSLEPGFVQGRQMINLDSEDEGIFTIGCAGGVDTTLTRSMDTQAQSESGRTVHLVVGGLKGGHSGIDIDKHRANANKILARLLDHIRRVSSVRIRTLDGGTRHNAIPRDAQTTLWVPHTEVGSVEQAVAHVASVVRAEYAATEPDLFIRLKKDAQADSDIRALTLADTDHTIQLLLALPNGIAGMSADFEGLVETSSNLATVQLADAKLTILISQRSAVMSRLEEITSRVHAVAALSGARVQDDNVYPPWQPDSGSSLLKRSKAVYQRMFGKSPVIQVIHAGLECAIIGDIYQGMDMISFGPTIQNPHSPDERILMPTVEKVWDFLVALLGDLTTV
jgi:dipeptidase D